jgi:hypothetical protein
MPASRADSASPPPPDLVSSDSGAFSDKNAALLRGLLRS